MPDLYRKIEIATCGENDQFCSDDCRLHTWDSLTKGHYCKDNDEWLKWDATEGAHMRTQECLKTAEVR